MHNCHCFKLKFKNTFNFFAIFIIYIWIRTFESIYTTENTKSTPFHWRHSRFFTDTIVSDEKVDTKTSDPDPNWEYEERWTYNCLTLHMPRLRQIYMDYAKMFTRSAPECNLTMSRLCLWQLWRDCNVDKRGLGLVEIDKYIGKYQFLLDY